MWSAWLIACHQAHSAHQLLCLVSHGVCLCVQEFLQALSIIGDECGMELVHAAEQLGADPAHLQGRITLCSYTLTLS